MTTTFTQIPFTGTVARRNKFINPRMLASPGGVAGAASSATGTLSWMTGIASVMGTGITSGARFTMSSAAATWVQIESVDGQTSPAVTPGVSYYFRAFMRMDLANSNTAGSRTQVRAGIYWLDGAFGNLTEVFGSVITLSDPGAGASSWGLVEITATAPAGAAYAHLEARISDGLPNGASLDTTGWRFDVAGTDTGYFDGDSTDVTPDVDEYRWTGPENGSESVEVVVSATLDQVVPKFGPIGPIEISAESNNVVHRLLDDPSVSWVTGKNSDPLTGTWKLLFDTWDAASDAATRLSSGVWKIESDLIDIPRWTMPEGKAASGQQVQELVPNSTGAEWLWELEVPWEQVSG